MKKDVQSYTVDNERLMKAKKQQDDFNLKLTKSLDIIERRWIKRMTQANQEVTCLLMRKEEQEVLADITITPQGIPQGDNTVSQVHPLSESVRRGLGWMSYNDKLTKSNLLHFKVSTRRMKMQRHGC
jgi:hypothetical protein